MGTEIILYHGSKEIIEFPEIRMARYNKDFYFGFYCTAYFEQAKRWATRFTGKGYISESDKLSYSPGVSNFEICKGV